MKWTETAVKALLSACIGAVGWLVGDGLARSGDAGHWVLPVAGAVVGAIGAWYGLAWVIRELRALPQPG